jgi:excisionase family DNA binding protein
MITKEKGDTIVSIIEDMEVARQSLPVLMAGLEAEQDTAFVLTSEGNIRILSKSPHAIPPKDIPVPAAAIHILADVLREMGKGNQVKLMPIENDMTTQQAADTLGVSRPYLIQLLETGKIPFHMVNTHRRVRVADVFQYREARHTARLKSLDELTAQAEELNMGY